jgi:homoserine dehydrogenase
MKLTVGVGLLGCGTVGANVAERLQRERETIERRSGVRYELRAIAIRDPRKARPDVLARRIFTRDARALVDDPQVDLVVELIGGTTDAVDLVEGALDRGCHVVTANKDLLATQGPRLQALARSRHAALRFEAAVAGAIPLLRVLDEALAGDEVLSVAGVVNGTCTSILSAMEEGVAYAEALTRAQQLGYAEADPTNDVSGADTAHKVALVAQQAFGLAVVSPAVARNGIAEITQRDVARARMLGYRIRVVGAAVRAGDAVFAQAGPVLVAEGHDFARAAGAQNVVAVRARDAGDLVLRGLGAGGVATTSAVLGDVVSVLRGLSERRDFATQTVASRLRSPSAIHTLFDRLPRLAELPAFPVWDDAITTTAAQAVAEA